MDDSANLNTPVSVQKIWEETCDAGFTMASEPLTGALLRVLATSKPGGRLLELGSGTGLATAWLLDGMDAMSTLVTVDNDAAALTILRNNLGNDNRLQVVCADGDGFIQDLKNTAFDLIFADTWAGKYRLLDRTLALVKPGGWYVVDDMLPRQNWPEGHATKASALVTALEQRDDFRIAKMSWASGVIAAVRI
ncbi:MAG: class I SAM-dependent methyltransferase [Herminiimonas sp.]|nr:class I SAM-dependent methyltransferase [Herminiimonas sp.]